LYGDHVQAVAEPEPNLSRLGDGWLWLSLTVRLDEDGTSPGRDTHHVKHAVWIAIMLKVMRL
jgi:hypothetical protein